MSQAVNAYTGGDKWLKTQREKYQSLKKFQKLCLCQYVYNNLNKNNNIKFIDKFSWKKVKKEVLKKSLNKNQNEIFKGFDENIYYFNPSIDMLANIMSKNSKNTYVSHKKIICEPIIWLVYIEYFLLDRQEKLQNLVLKARNYNGTTNNNYNINCNPTILQNNHNNNNNINNNNNDIKQYIVKGQKLDTLISNLAKQAKDESDRLRGIMARLPSVDDLRNTIEKELINRDNNKTLNYTKTFKTSYLMLHKKHIALINKQPNNKKR